MLALPRGRAHRPRGRRPCLRPRCWPSGQRDYKPSVLFLNEATDIYRELGDKQGTAVVLNARGVYHIEQGDFAEATTAVSKKAARSGSSWATT